MENKDLGSKKINNQQTVNEGFSGENIPEEKNPPTPLLKTEVEIDVNGNPIVVQRARHVDEPSEQNDNNSNQNPSSNIEIISEKQTKKMIENKDHNSDITAKRYPNSHPDNHEDRGNIKLDE
jgi:hypothetical protein